jgi:8-oxo-dGTP diphosphatase
MEELNVAITKATPWISFIMVYTHATVRLNCWRVSEWQGEMRGMEGQQFQWQRLDALTVAPTLPGCAPIFRALSLPQIYAITNADEMGIDGYLDALEGALEKGLKLIQVREKKMPPPMFAQFARQVVMRAHAHGARVLVNSDIELAREINADGVHLTALQLNQSTARPDVALVGASTHTRAEIERAAALKLDFAVLGAVKPTLTHPDQTPLGWKKFAALVEVAPLPVYALGGLSVDDLAEAMTHAAHGVAMQRGLPAK